MAKARGEGSVGQEGDGRRRHEAAVPADTTGWPVRPAVAPVDRVFKGVVSGLFNGSFAPGQRLVESDLMARFQVTRGMAREGLKKLAVDGVVELTRHKGANIMALSREDTGGILLIMEVIIGLAARLAAINCDAAGEQALRARLADMEAYGGKAEPGSFAEARNEFFLELLRLSGNEKLSHLLQSSHVFLVRSQFRHYPSATGEHLLEDYRKITDAVVARDGVAAERVTRAHVRHMARAIEKLPDEAFPYVPS